MASSSRTRRDSEWLTQDLVPGYWLERAGTNETEFERLRLLHADAMREGINKLLGWDTAYTQSQVLEYLHSRWGKGDLRWILDETSGEMVGSIDAHITPAGQLYINRFYLDSRTRGKGIGGRIMTALLAKTDGARIESHLSTVRGSRASAFYERLGYRKVGMDQVQEFFERQTPPV
jgi:GNAT superfamily N-acetyltransferase